MAAVHLLETLAAPIPFYVQIVRIILRAIHRGFVYTVNNGCSTHITSPPTFLTYLIPTVISTLLNIRMSFTTHDIDFVSISSDRLAVVETMQLISTLVEVTRML